MSQTVSWGQQGNWVMADGRSLPAARSITVRDLLTLTFGFGLVFVPSPIQAGTLELGVIGDGTANWPTIDQHEWLRRLGTLPLVYQPGERWQYHVGSDVLGVLVSRVAGQSFEAFLRERVFAPLGMVDTGFHAQLDRLPTSCARDPTTGEPAVWDTPAGKYSRPSSFKAGGECPAAAGAACTGPPARRAP